MIKVKDGEYKMIKREFIKAAAYKLFIKNNHRLPNVIDIAKEAEIAKGTIYIYFNTREEIYLEILKSKISLWFDEIENTVDLKEPTAETVVDAICNYINENPDFLSLLSILNNILEQNIDEKLAFRFKKEISVRIKEISDKIEDKFKIINSINASKLLLQGYALIIGLWQVTSFPESIKTLLQDEELLILNVDFNIEIKAALKNLWKGTLIEGIKEKI